VSEIEKVLVVLSGKTHPCVLLVGEVGSGKRAIVEGVAGRFAAGALPDGLPLQRVVALDIGLLHPGGDRWKQAAERLRASFFEARKSQTAVCFDGMSFLFADWGTGLACLFKALLRQSPPPLIAPITPAEYREFVAPDEDLSALFQPIFVGPLTREETLAVLRHQSGAFEAHHGVLIPDVVLPLVVEQAGRSLSGCLPGKALRLLDRAAALVRIRTHGQRPDLGSLDHQIEQLNQQKEAAISEQDFEKAARFRDQADQIKRCRDQAVRAWEDRCRRSIPVVDEQSVAEALALLGGDNGEARPNVIA
jgi:ATP-dependent Clp protease ATP-binding subunit ClpC